MKSPLMALAMAGALTAASATAGPAEAKAKTVHSPASIECTKQADAKGLHGKARKTFRAACKKDFKATASNPSMTKPARPEPKP